jgi:hypothetical protein
MKGHVHAIPPRIMDYPVVGFQTTVTMVDDKMFRRVQQNAMQRIVGFL